MHAVCSISRWFLSWPAAAYCAVLFTIASPTVAGSFVPISVERSVSADAESIVLGLVDFASDLNLSPDLTDFAASASASSFLDGLSGWGSALQVGSILDPMSVTSTGSANASGSASNPNGAGSYFSDSFFYLMFQLNTPQSYRLSGMINAFAFGTGGDADAFVELVQIDASTETVLFSSSVVAGALDPSAVFDSGLLFLDTGVQYRLSAGATSVALVDSAAPSGSGSGGFDFVLSVPEPGTGLLLVVGFGGLLWATRRRTVAALQPPR